MQDTWREERSHFVPLATKVRALREPADAMWHRGRASCCDVECAVHQVAVSSLDVDDAFVCVWGKSCRRVHRTERQYGTLAGNVTFLRLPYSRSSFERGGHDVGKDDHFVQHAVRGDLAIRADITLAAIGRAPTRVLPPRK